MTIEDLIAAFERIEGVTPGPWGYDELNRGLCDEYIALCSPENIAMMIARIRELEENVRVFTEHAAFKVGDLVEKIDGDTKYPGEVRSVYTTRKGKLRMVVECTVPEVDGLQHIYRPDQFKLLERNRR